jgi:hypothetical protein
MALVALAPWTLLSMLTLMQAGGVRAIHALWLLAIMLVLVASPALSVLATLGSLKLEPLWPPCQE